jgi:hypothetical protein
MKPITQYIRHFGITFLETWSNPQMAGMTALIVYILLGKKLWLYFGETPEMYFNYLADAFLHGQVNLRLDPVSLHDLVLYQGKIYLYWAPFPAILILPLVAIFGIHFSDILLVIVLAILNVATLALLLRNLDQKGILVLDGSRRGALVLFFALGSVVLPMAPMGSVWGMSQLVGSLFVILSYLAATGLRGWKAFILTGLALSCATATRNQLLLTGIWPAYFLLSIHWKEGKKKVVQYILLGLLPLIVTVGGLAWYNWARFGNFLDNGLKYHNMDPFFRANIDKYGYFNLHFIPINIFYQFINYPFPWRSDSMMGGSLFLLSPVLFGAFWGIAKERPRLSVFFLVLSILATCVPILLYMATGFAQIGPRYTLDFHVPLILLTAMGVKRWPTWLVSLLVFISCFHYFWAFLVTT